MEAVFVNHGFHGWHGFFEGWGVAKMFISRRHGEHGDFGGEAGIGLGRSRSLSCEAVRAKKEISEGVGYFIGKFSFTNPDFLMKSMDNSWNNCLAFWSR
jgi:hypothetical protein